MLIGAERVISAGGDERRVTFPKFQLLLANFEHSASFEHDVDLVVCVYARMVWLWRDKRVDADLIVAAIRGPSRNHRRRRRGALWLR